MEKMQIWVSIITGFITIAGVVFLVYKTFTDPDIKVERTIQEMRARCELKHQYLDENIIGIKENHLKHLEADMAFVKGELIEIKTILKERNV